ncbi:hypothetical protein GCM10009422_28880 [Brevundimonas kwangchunensis]|uniref:Uncharacterized protein n=1 Tax=Brevundimonas kwangchunensis TaxID=322163 RepID=A0ABN1H5N1_9CAUL
MHLINLLANPGGDLRPTGGLQGGKINHMPPMFDAGGVVLREGRTGEGQQAGGDKEAAVADHEKAFPGLGVHTVTEFG